MATFKVWTQTNAQTSCSQVQQSHVARRLVPFASGWHFDLQNRMAASILQVAASHGLSNRAIIHAGGAQNPARGKVRFQADWPLPHRAFLSTSPPCSRRFKKQGGCLYPLRNTSSIPAASLRRLQLWMKLACFLTSTTSLASLHPFPPPQLSDPKMLHHSTTGEGFYARPCRRWRRYRAQRRELATWSSRQKGGNCRLVPARLPCCADIRLF